MRVFQSGSVYKRGREGAQQIDQPWCFFLRVTWMLENWPTYNFLHSDSDYNDAIFQDIFYFHLISFNIILPQTVDRYPALYNINIKTLGEKSICKQTLIVFSISARKFPTFSPIFEILFLPKVTWNSGEL